MLIGITGYAGSGKDTIADLVVKEYGFAKVALADPMKRICKEVFGFSDEQLWGPSECRNEPDGRYRRKLLPFRGTLVECSRREIEDLEDQRSFGGDTYLTPRYALQTLGSEWGRNCHLDVWVQYAIRVAEELYGVPFDEAPEYTQKYGVWGPPQEDHVPYRGVVVPDIRFKNELDALKNAGAKLIRVRRPGYDGNITGGIPGHASEAEQDSIPDDKFDFVIQNDSTIDKLYESVRVCLTSIIPG